MAIMTPRHEYWKTGKLKVSTSNSPIMSQKISSSILGYNPETVAQEILDMTML